MYWLQRLLLKALNKFSRDHDWCVPCGNRKVMVHSHHPRGGEKFVPHATMGHMVFRCADCELKKNKW